MTFKQFCSIAAVAASLTAAPAYADDDDDKRKTPPVVQELIDCRAITDDAARLACFDSKSAALAQAEGSGEIIMADREQIREARRGLFGFSLPRIRLFGGRDEDEEANLSDEEAVRTLDSTIKSVRETSRGYVFELQEGGTWAQTDGQYPGLTPRAGQKINIRRAALGSYMGKIEDRVGFRIERVR